MSKEIADALDLIMKLMPKYRDLSEMPDDALRALANDLANPKEAMKRIRTTQKLES